MTDAEPRVVMLLAASYDSEDDARADFEVIEALYQELGASDLFDAAVLTKSEDGKVSIAKTYEAGTRHDALRGLGWGLAAGAVAALFPAVGIGAALAVGGVGGSAIGGLVGHHQRAVSRGDLKELGEVLDQGTAGLIVAYAADLADQVEQRIKVTNKYVSQITDEAAEEIASAIRESGQDA